MSFQIRSIYTNTREKNSNFKIGHGQSFLVENKKKKKKILFDIGAKGEDILFNMKLLNINPNDIDFLAFSHGHYDHTRGIKQFLQEREKSIVAIGHPDILKPKKAKLKKWFFDIKIDIGFPTLQPSLKKKINFVFQRELYEITENIYLSGEITNRIEKEGTEEKLVHLKDKRWEKDPLLDDQALVIKTIKGLVIICGCCHAGLLNTLSHVTQLFPGEKIHSVIGGTHMIKFSKQDLEHIAQMLIEKYNKPRLYLNHCTGPFAFEYLQQKIGINIVKPFHTGSKLTFD